MSDVDRLLSLLPRLAEAFRLRRFQGDDSASSLTAHQLRLLRLLDRHDPVMVGELADFVGVTASTMSLNLKRLEGGGLVVRTRDPADRRVVNVLLTEEGQGIIDAAPVLDPGRLDAALRTMNQHERHRAIEGLALLVEAADRSGVRHAEYLDALTGPPHHEGARQ